MYNLSSFEVLRSNLEVLLMLLLAFWNGLCTGKFLLGNLHYLASSVAEERTLAFHLKYGYSGHGNMRNVYFLFIGILHPPSPGEGGC